MAYQLPPPPSVEDPLIRGWLFELYKRNNSLVDSATALNGMADVTITSVGDNEVLAWDSGSSLWINQTAAEAGLVSGSTLSSQFSTASGTESLVFIT